MQKVNKKVGGTRVESRKFKVQSRRGISEVGLPKIDVGLTKSYIKRVEGTRVESRKFKVESRGLRLRAAGLVIFAMVAVWLVLPANGAEAAFRRNFRI